MSTLSVIGWCIYYSDGSTFSSEDGSWAQAPADDVQVLEILHPPPYRTIDHGVDEYRLPGESIVKLGRWMDEAGLYRIIEGVHDGGHLRPQGDSL